VWVIAFAGDSMKCGGDLAVPELFAPFTKLEPVAETAKHFVAAYRAYSSGTNRTVKQLDQAVEYVARKEFGVTP